MKYFIASDIHARPITAAVSSRLMNGKGLTDWSSSATSSITDRATTFPRTIIRKTSLPCSTKEGCHPLRPRQLRQRSRSDGPGISHHGAVCILTQGSLVVYATHGDHYNTHRLPPLQKGDILLHGHTHLPVWEPFGQDNYYLNPGSASLPKDGNPHSYLSGKIRPLPGKTWTQGLPRTDFIRSREKGAACLFGTVGIGPPSGSSPIREKSENQTDGRP